MSSIKNYIRLATHIRNWPTYFKRKERKKESVRYITKGVSLRFDVPFDFFYVFKEIFLEDFYQINQWLPLIRENAIIIDIGGNVGYFSFLIASKLENATVYAFEPMGKNIDIFEKNINLNSGLNKRLIVTAGAVTGDQAGTIPIFFDDIADNSVIASVVNDFSSANNRSLQVRAIPLIDIIQQNNIEQIDLLKMDCEGSEYPILYESPDTIWPLIKCIIIEVHDLDTDKRNAAFLFGFLKKKGFSISSRTESAGCYSAVAVKK